MKIRRMSPSENTKIRPMRTSENKTRMRSRWEWPQTVQLWLQLPGGQSCVGGNHLDRDNRLGHWPLPMLTSSDQGGDTHPQFASDFAARFNHDNTEDDV